MNEQEHVSSDEGGEGVSEAEHRCVFGECDGTSPSHVAAARRFFWPEREEAMDAAVHEVTRDFIVEVLSWAETVEDGRLGSERAEALLSAHETRILASRAESAEAALDAARREAEGLRARLGAVEATMGRLGHAEWCALLWEGECTCWQRDLRAALVNPPAVQREGEGT